MKKPEQVVKEWALNRVQLRVGRTCKYLSRESIREASLLFQRESAENPLYSEVMLLKHLFNVCTDWRRRRINRWVAAFFWPLKLARFESMNEIKLAMKKKGDEVRKTFVEGPVWLAAIERWMREDQNTVLHR